MSFDIFLTCFRGGKPVSFKREVFEDIFLPHCDHPKTYPADPEFMRVRFPDGSGSDIYLSTEYDMRQTAIDMGELPEGTDIGINDESLIESVSFNHCGGDMMFQAMYALAERTGAVIYWPSENPPSTVVTNEAVLKDLPEESFDLATVWIVHSGPDIVKAIEAS